MGCDAFTAKVRLYPPRFNEFYVEQILCTKKKRATTLEQCRECSLVTAPTTKEIITNTVGLFQSETFYSAYQNLEDARKRLRDGDYDGAITQSISCLESVMKTVLDRCDTPHPSDPSVTKLWGSVKKELNFEEFEGADKVISLLGTLSGAVSHLGGVRNHLGDAHGNGEDAPEVPFMFAELAINTSSTLATVIVRRFNQIKEK
ncbi:abortive infection family protein [Methanogenium sp. MK-MG]|uniref:abortive infection family protein n=1 Tax=Methanogenium sp. MK-MG TaxID=2599926 RepID=UPI0013EAB21C|nr:abortive infection family protein [Methanogenium sp. MK-MG]